MRKFIDTFRELCLLSFSLFIFQLASAQQGTVKGTVKDASGNPLANASVTVQGKRVGTTTNEAGNYSLALPAGKHTISVSFVGTSTQHIVVTVVGGNVT